MATEPTRPQPCPRPAVRPRVFILSALRLLREGIAAALARQATIEVVGLGDAGFVADEIARFQPDVVLLDVYVPGMLAAVGPLRQAMPFARVVALGAAETEPVVMACARTGVSGFIGPEGSAHDMVNAIHAAVRGELVCSPRTAALLLHGVLELAGGASAAVPPEALTPREREILGLMSEGLSNKQIARHLGIRDG